MSIFARHLSGPFYAILDEASGDPVTRLESADRVYPWEQTSAGTWEQVWTSCAYEHPRGIVLTAAQVDQLQISREG